MRRDPICAPPTARRWSSRRQRLGRDGTTVLEFALVAPVFFLVLVMIAELSLQLAIDLALNLGAIAGSRYAVTGIGYTAGTRDAAIRTAALAASGILQSASLTLTDASYASAASYAAGGAATAGSGMSGQFVVYTLTYVQSFMTTLPATFLGISSITHTATVLVQNEPF